MQLKIKTALFFNILRFKSKFLKTNRNYNNIRSKSEVLYHEIATQKTHWFSNQKSNNPISKKEGKK